jgi:signal transduction histidine kinase/Tfp pilus assembly protein PilF
MCDFLTNGFNFLRPSIIIILVSFTYSSSAQANIDSLVIKAEKSPIEERSNLYMDLFVKTISNIDSAMFFAEEARKYALLVGDSLNYTRSEYAIAYLFKNQGYADKAISHYLIALNTARNNQFIEREKKALNGLALAFYGLSQFDKSLKYHFESLALREKEGNQIEISVSVNNIGLVYFQLGDFSKAIIYFNRAKAIEEARDNSEIEGTYTNLGLAYLRLGKLNNALDNFNKAISICKIGCLTSTYVQALNGAGSCLFDLGRMSEARENLSAALILAEQDQMETNLTSIYYNIAKIDLAQDLIDDALTRLDLSQKLAGKLNLRLETKKNFKLYAILYNNIGEYQKAYMNQVKYDSVSSQILDDVIVKNLLQIQLDFEERQNLEIIDLQNKELGRQSTLLILSIIISLLTVFIVLILYRNNKVRRRVNTKLFDANNIIENQNKKLTELNVALEERVKDRTEELKNSNVALIQSNQDLDNFIYKTSHDIRGPLATLQGICNIALMDVKEAVAVDYLQKLSKTAHKLNQILSKLLVINQINNSLPNHEEVKIYELVDSIVESNRISYLGKELDIIYDLLENQTIDSDSELLGIIIRNLVNNAFKFHNKSKKVDSFIKIQSSINGSVFNFSITDNGIGIDDGISDQIFDIFSKTSELHDAAGLGLYLVKLATDKLEGQISVKTTQEGYTFFNIQIPI